MFLRHATLHTAISSRKSGAKKKLNSFVQYPEELDLSSYLRQRDGTHVYSLTGVLMHMGPQAHQGHYIAHIQVLTVLGLSH